MLTFLHQEKWVNSRQNTNNSLTGDSTIATTAPLPSPPVFLHEWIEQSCRKHGDQAAVIWQGKTLTYQELDNQANQLARYLISKGIKPGRRIGILLNRSFATYISLFAILKTGAVFVPMDSECPAKRIDYVAKDAELTAIITTSECIIRLSELSNQFPLQIIYLDNHATAIAAQSDRPIPFVGRPDKRQPRLCYIMYTSGSTGTPKGVAISHRAICNFVQVAAQTYDIHPADRVYQGMTIAFDFSVEEIWLGLLKGATLVAGPVNEQRLGTALADFLIEQKVTVFCCVPTLLATLDKDIPSLRTLIVGGEACPQHLVERWAKKGRKMLNTYGPTEATVTATWGELYPGKPVTIGRAMPTYTVYILDENNAPVAHGKTGEICIAGIGLAEGYINQPEITRQAFIKDCLNTPDNPSGRIYRTGDLGRITDNLEIEYLGRIDSQVKIRGYRIELTEIESIILESAEVAKVAVAPYEFSGQGQELVAYCELKRKHRTTFLNREAICKRLTNRVPAYMIPAFLEQVTSLPLLANGKVDRNRLPAPISKRYRSSQTTCTPPANSTEQLINDEICRLLKLEQVSVTDDFFTDLGAHSLLVAKLVSILRHHKTMQNLSLGDLYHYPTIRQLADVVRTNQKKSTPEKQQQNDLVPVYSNRRVLCCGLMQLLATVFFTALYAVPALFAVQWLGQTVNWSSPDYFRIFFTGALTTVASLLLSLACPVLFKRLLFNKVQSGSYPLWGTFYLRFWIFDKLLSSAPLVLFSGTPLLSTYYRLFGAKIGKNVTICSALVHMPQLVVIGDGTAINTGSHIFCYAMERNRLHLEKVTLYSNCIIGSNSVLMPGSTVGQNSVLGHQSLLESGCTLPQNSQWAGSPARPVTEALAVPAASCQQGNAPETIHWLRFLPAIVMITLVPLIASFPALVITMLGYQAAGTAGLFTAILPAAISFVFFLQLTIIFLKKIIQPSITPGTYRINSDQYLQKFCIDRLMELSLGLTNSLYATLYLAPFLRRMGAKIGRMAEVSTISHITPDLLEIGDESFVADIAHLGPGLVGHGCFAVNTVEVGTRSFVGNGALIPGNTRIKENALIGVLSTPPGPVVPAETTWLGSPPLHLPEREQSDYFPDHLTFNPTRRLYIKRLSYEFFRVTGPATLTMAAAIILLLLSLLMLSTFSIWLTALGIGMVSLVVGTLCAAIIALIKLVLIGKYTPQVQPMWSTFVWRSELITALYENVVVPLLLSRLTGTPFLAMILSIFGAKIGSRCCIETTYLTEFDLVQTGDDCCIGKYCSLQTHLFEDRVMKMAKLRIGNCCSVGPRAVILYDTNLEDNVQLEGLSLVMKGETLTDAGKWHGCPATRQ